MMLGKNINLTIMLTLLFLLKIPLSVSQTVLCDRIDGCSNKKTQGMSYCGICDNKGSGVGDCVFPLANKFVAGKVKEDQKIEICSKNMKCLDNCNGNGQCFNEVDEITSVCICSDKFYEVTCNTPVPPKFIGAFPLRAISMEQYDVFYLPAVEKEVSFYRFCNPSLKYYKIPYLIIVDTPEGFYHCQEITSERCSKEVPKQGSQIPTTKVTLVYPFKKYEKGNDKHFRFNEKILGYVSSVRVRAVLPESQFVFYELTNPVRVTYEPASVTLGCVPVIRLSGCGSTKENSVSYYMKQSFQIESNIMYIENGKNFFDLTPGKSCNAFNPITWSVWKYNTVMNEKDPKQKPTQTFARVDLSFNAYKTRPGHYLVKMKVDHIKGQIVTNHAYCHFKVKTQPPVARITVMKNGDMRFGGTSEFLVELWMEDSYDPNLPPDQPQGLSGTWRCHFRDEPQRYMPYCNPNRMTIVDAKSLFVAFGDRPQKSETLVFTLTVTTDNYEDCIDESLGCVTTDQAVEYITIPGTGEKTTETISIQCVKNCGAKVSPHLDLFLKATITSENKALTTTWTYGESIDTQDSVEDISEPNLQHWMLLVKANKLDQGKQYVFVAKVTEDTMAEYRVETLEMEYTEVCEVKPDSGFKAQTLFNIQCPPGAPDFVFEYYDKYLQETTDDYIFSGRMLGMNVNGRLTDFKLTRGYVVIYVLNTFGLFKQMTKKIDLQDITVDENTLNQWFEEIDDMLAKGYNTDVMLHVSFIPDMVPDWMNKSDTLNRLLTVVPKLPVEYLPKIKMRTNTLYVMLEKLNQPTRVVLSPELMMNTLSLMYILTADLSHLVNWGDDVTSLSPRELLRLAEVQLRVLQSVLKCRDPETEGKDLDDFNFKTLNDLTQGSIHAEETLSLIEDLMTYVATPGLPPLSISTADKEMIMSSLKNDVGYPITEYLDGNKKLPVFISEKLMDYLMKKVKSKENLNIEITTMDDNIFWWCKSDIRSNLVSVSISRELPRRGIIKVESITPALAVNLRFHDDVTPTLVSGEVVQPDPTLSPVRLDLAVMIHRLDPEPHSLTNIKFLFPETTHNLRVFVVTDYRPHYDTMLRSAVVVSSASPTYPGPLVQKASGHFLYIGILPAADVPVNEKVTYKFEFGTSLCQTWAQGQWSSLGCKISPESKDKDVVCKCEHFSIFAAAFPVPPHEINLYQDLPLFLTVYDNPVVVCFVLCVLLLYLLTCVWAYVKDRDDKRLKYLMVLEDNFPGDKWPYLVAVYTGSRINAGSTAHVGIRIFGTLSQSRVHILTCKSRRLLKKNSDDWFLMYCQLPLGEVTNIHIWHDNSGSSPNWFCDEIRVFDLTDDVETTFVIEQWLALRANEFPEALVTPTRQTDVKGVKRMLLTNLVLGLRESHTLLSIVFRHPRSEVNRVQRISVLMSGIMVAMLCSIMFYVPKDENWEGVDDLDYDVTTRDFYISIQSAVLCVLATLTVMFCFHRSYKVIKQNSELNKQDQLLEESIDRQDRKASVYDNFVRLVTRALKSFPLAPVQLPFSDPIVQVRKIWLVTAWSLCVVLILVCALLVMLYGLKLGKVRSVKWLTALLLTLAHNLMIEGPARIFLIAIILALAFQRMVDMNSHRVTLKDVLCLETPNDELTVTRIQAKRNHPMYAPLHHNVRKEMIQKKQRQDRCWLMVNFVISVLFVGTVSFAAYSLWSSHFYDNSQLQKEMALAHPFRSMEPIDFYKIHDYRDLEVFLKYGLVRNLYTTRWYNDRIFQGYAENKYWTEDRVHKMIGFPKLRQLRVLQRRCANMILKEGKSCISAWSEQNEDIDLYSTGWKMGHYSDLNRPNSPWLHRESTTSKLSTMYRLYGKTGRRFDTRGYALTLGPTRQKTELMIAELQEHHWQDLRTKVVFVELTLYNVNQDLFSQVTLTTEYLISGRIQLQCQVFSVDGRMEFHFWNALFIAFFIIYTVQAAMIMNRQGLLNYLTTFRNVSRLIVIALSLTCIVLMFLHHNLITTFQAQFQQQGQDSYFDFDSFVYYFLQLKVLISLLLCVAITRAVLLFRGGRILINHFYTLIISWHWIFWLGFITYVSVLVEFTIATNCNIFTPSSFTYFLVNPKTSSFVNSEETTYPHMGVFLLFKILTIGIIDRFYILTFLYNTRLAKSHKLRKSDHFSYFSFILSYFKRK